ncbi:MULTISPECIES: hypothetical protein [unclassified Escherichia]|uniref:hypothetical protein n=1 Tax=unclassified Escherichia TaxID=2608889 RepID=UPI00107FE22A|nr:MULTISPECIES: hypothetical protein [unclassified Escherichia]TGB80903.1 hypothetical protein CRI66_00135 [Escherichia sp. E4694]TLJ03249.1 hypothetical protein FEK49_06260 [Escherichia sp. E4385]
MNDHETLENMMKEIQQVVTHHAGAKTRVQARVTIKNNDDKHILIDIGDISVMDIHFKAPSI